MFMNVHMYSLLLLRVVDVSFLGHLFQCSNAKMSSRSRLFYGKNKKNLKILKKF